MYEHLHKEVRVRQVGYRPPLRGSERCRVRERAAQLLGTHLRGDHPEAGCLCIPSAAACDSSQRVRVLGLEQVLALTKHTSCRV